MRIVVTAPLPPIAYELLSPLGLIEVAGDGDSREWTKAEILIVRGEHLDETTIEMARQLRVIARTGVGIDRIDVSAATRRGIPLIYAPGAGALQVAEGAFALMLAAAKRLREFDAVMKSGAWPSRYEIEPLDLHGATLGIIGLGRIGREVARLARSFDMTVIAHDPAPAPDLGEVTNPVRLVGLGELAAASDIISLHCNLSEQTRGLIDRSFLSETRPGLILINAARGEIVQSDEVLLEALASGRLGGLGLDVFSIEPPNPDSPLLHHPRVISTPHAIGLTRQWNKGVFSSLARDIAAVLAAKRPRHIVNPEVLDRERHSKPAELEARRE